MLKQIKNNWVSAIAITCLIFALVCVRAFENQLFSDPLLDFFKGQFNKKPLPAFDAVSISVNYFFRFALNSIISLTIIFMVYKNWNQIKFASVLYAVFFVILISCLLMLLNLKDEKWYMIIFYIRRFIIQPLFLLLFLPAFYYQKLLQKAKV